MSKAKAPKKKTPQTASKKSDPSDPPKIPAPSTPEMIAKHDAKPTSPFSFKIRTASPKKKIKNVNEVGSIDDEDDFKENIDYIHTYFRKGEILIPPEFQERLHAPHLHLKLQFTTTRTCTSHRNLT